MKKEYPEIQISVSDQWKDYELIDSGEGMKLERFGSYTFARPEAQAIWKKALPESTWKKASASFLSTGEENGGHWVFAAKLPERWPVTYKSLKCWIQPAASRHLGVFPEQASGWDWMSNLIQSSQKQAKVLNLFGYTGMASLAAAAAGAQVTHVDASKKAITSARENQELSGLESRSIRWIVDDALKFVQREARRGSTYEGLILDPPKFGRGPKGEVWEFFDLIPTLLESCRAILSTEPVFVLLTAYAIKSSALTLHGAMTEMMRGKQGSLQVGELVTCETSAKRLISNSIYAKWEWNK
jgi:23S rRNA (cytosine1962-C5)-methyltransferase